MLSRKTLEALGFSAALLATSAIVGTAQATILVTGSLVFPSAFSAPSGTLLASISTPWVDTTANMSGTADSAVFADPSNTFCAGCLDFVYQVSNNANSTDSIGRVTAINFAGWLTDVGIIFNGAAEPGGLFVNGTDPPELADRVSSDVIGFSFNAPLLEPVAPGQTSNVFVIETNAKTFGPGNLNIIDGGVTTVSAFAPTAAVPEPASWALMILGVGAVGVSLRFARRERVLVESLAG